MDKAQYQAWAGDYRAKRYLEHATEQELRRRLDDIFVNMIVFTDDGRAVVRKPLEANLHFRLFAHFFEEMKLRNQWPYSFPLNHIHFDDEQYPKVRRAGQLWRERGLKHGSCMLKFGKFQYLEPLLNRGEMRLCPASFYREPSLAAAINDDELQFTQQLHGATVKIQDPDGTWRTAETVGPLRLTHTATSDYYLSCYAVLFENRLFDDFQADACLIIKDVDRFCNLLRDAVDRMRPKWTCIIGGVQYRDPYFPTRAPDVYFTKHFRYAYQREFRMIWGPPEPVERLEPLHVEMGDLSSICELIRL